MAALRFGVAVFAALVLAFPGRSDADPITITVTAGQVTFLEEQSSWTLLDDGLDIRFGNDDLIVYFQCSLEPCQAGAVVSPTPLVQPFSGPPGGDWPMTVNGQQIQGRLQNFFFFAPLIELPESSLPVTLSSPFLSTGEVADFQGNLVSYLTGEGTALMSLVPVSGGFRVGRVTFQFDDSQPVPEPGTLLLLVSGAAALGRHVWGRKRT